jgi:hypothetical protein
VLLKRLYPPRARVLSDPISQALFAFGRPRVSRLFDDRSLRLKRSR